VPEEPEPASARLGGRLAEGLAALKAGRPADAIGALSEVCAGLRDAPELRDVRARALSLLAQALLGVGRPSEALAPADAALRLARELHDTEGVAEIEAIRGELVEAAVRAAARPPARPLTVEREALLHEAGVAVEAGRIEEAIGCATRALTLAREVGDVRVEVLARLVLARATPAHAAQELIVAHSLADERDEFTLVGVVARTATLLGVRLPSAQGPDARRRA
jgi:tetratricopeptide (TPR) repeat protein